MKKFFPFAFALISILAGCAASFSTGALLPGSISDCESGDIEQDKSCYRDRAAQARDLLAVKPEQEVAEKFAQEIVEERSAETPPSDQPPRSRVPMEYVPVVFPTVGSEGCVNAHNFAFVNNTNHYLEVTARKLLPCGESGLVVQYVQTANGGTRPAYLIPPGSYGWYYTPLNGIVPYQILAYDPSGLSGRPGQPPRQATGGVYRNSVELPLDANWHNRKIDKFDFLM
jgi:hypothetical protein